MKKKSQYNLTFYDKYVDWKAFTSLTSLKLQRAMHNENVVFWDINFGKEEIFEEMTENV